MIGRRYGPSALVFATLITLSGIATPGAADRGRHPAQPTAGVLAAELARVASAGPSARDAGSRLLESAGIASSPGAPLTEGMAALMLGRLGIDSGTSNPARLVSGRRMAALVLLAEKHLQAQTAVPASFQTSPATLNDCMVLRTHGACVNCCKGEGFSASLCAKECFVINKPSPSEPLP